MDHQALSESQVAPPRGMPISAASHAPHDPIDAKATAKVTIKWLLMEGYCRGLLPAWFVGLAFRVVGLRNE